MHPYLIYLEQVLGIRKVLVDRESIITGGAILSSSNDSAAFEAPAFFYNPSGAIKEGHSFTSVPLAIVNFVEVAEDSLFEAEVSELFQKMLGALKLPENKVLVLDCLMNERALIAAEFLKIADAQIVLFFSRTPQNLGDMKQIGNGYWLETYSPAHLLEKPQDKGQVWGDMQRIMKGLGL